MGKVKNWDAVELGKLRQQEKAPHKKPHKANKLPAAVGLGTLGGKVGGKARAKVLSAKRRKQIAKQGGLARHKKK